MDGDVGYAGVKSAAIGQIASLASAGLPAQSRHERPWGYYEDLLEGYRFRVKRIVVEPGKKLSLQKHIHRAEHWVVVAGTASVTCGTEEFLLTEGETVFIPLAEVHRMANPGSIPLAVIEVQIGSYVGEDDIIRISDDFGRA